MKKWLLRIFLLLVLYLGYAVSPLLAQGQLSVQVLQLLTRVNTWVGTQTFQDIRVPVAPCAAVPSVTAGRIYTDASCNLYFNGALIVGAGGVTNPHNLLSVTHPDTLAASPTRGDVIVANATPAWARVAIGGAGTFLRSNATDASWGTDGSALTNLPAANLTGTLPAISGVNLTALNASNLGSGTVPIARLSGITNAQIDAAAAIAYSKLNLVGSITNADLAAGTVTNTVINAGAAIVYSKLSLGASILFSDWGSNGCANGQIPKSNGASWSCGTDNNSGGTVTSAAITLPSFLSVAGSPITTTGTFAVTLATQTANTVFAGPTGGGAVAPTFRALVNADFPTSGVVPGTFSKVTVNAQGIVTVGATASLTADVSGILPVANGGTNLSSAANHATIVGDGTTWQSRVIPDCVSGALAFTQATNLFSCQAGGVAHNFLSATHSDTLADTVVRGDVIVGNATPKWSRLALGVAPNVVFVSNGTDAVWSNTIAMGTVTTAQPLSITQTWNAAVTFTGLKVNITSTSSNAGSLLADLQLAGSSIFSVDKLGNVNSLGNLSYSTAVPTITSGFGGGSIAGKVHDFRITLAAAAVGVVAFNTTFATAPVCQVTDETTATTSTALVVPTTTQVTITPGTGAGATDKLAVHCGGF